ncbi:phenylacetate-CoA oxygenase subunit PaaC [Cryomorpha ignava]|uniref:Phenylacetate-CoA oxygenase subunit PaaC n=1 Tax=Cryomorpha ignava TaxID=101383 RepID=A0A7K3WV94_9FLAO|nr:1,2-phenylacetyl-CoA epoxidase subunit PaaC [Cryomorpha ignava]NEN24832.1 phenylacetate-CoA oxygenase subunit PaaC [Cryomorpha ignava]
MTEEKALYNYLIRLGDNALILGQRLGEWCGHAHQLESDIALTNVALDQIGQARLLLSEAANLQGEGKSEDHLAFHRDEQDFRNNLLVEMENGDFGQTITRQFLFDVYQYHLLKAFCKSENDFLKAFAEKSIKEVTYHRSLSRDWMVRLGDGTENSHQKMQDAINLLWQYTGELFEMDESDEVLMEAGIVPDLSEIKSIWDKEVKTVIDEATLAIPDTRGFMATGARKKGEHTEYMGYILSEMQYLPRSMPDAKW